MEIAEILERFKPWREAHKRLAWIPVVEPGDGEITASKFSGQPALKENEPYPRCGCCQTPMALLLQLNLNELPSELIGQFGQGLLQLFYCLECDSYAPFEENKLVRIIEPDRYTSIQYFPDNFGLPVKRIVGWTPVEDYPDASESEELGLTFEYAKTADSILIECPDFGIAIELPDDSEIEIENLSDAVRVDKLVGYPNWLQDIEYPRCPECQRRMEFVFQIQHEDNLPIQFGDAGRGHITQCPEHKHILTFAWACC